MNHFGMFDNPGRVDAHVVGHHVAGEADAVMVGAVAQGDVGRFAAQIVGNAIVEERIGRGDGFAVAAKLLDSARGAAALPNADEPERIDAAMRELARDLRRESRRGGRCDGCICGSTARATRSCFWR